MTRDPDQDLERSRLRSQIEQIGDHPLSPRGWTGKIVSVDGAPTDNFGPEVARRIVHYGECSRTRWCEMTAGVIELSDGRFVSWDCSFPSIGAAIYCDFVGGGADIFVARTEEAALSMISEQACELFASDDSAMAFRGESISDRGNRSGEASVVRLMTRDQDQDQDRSQLRSRIEEMADSPFSRRGWTGQIVSVDGSPTGDFGIEDACRIVHYGECSRTQFCGKSAGVVELSDGRFVSWESSFEPSGSGFYCDFVGGGADVFVARTEAAALSMISEQAREMFGGARS